MSRRCPEGWKRMWERLEGPLQVCRRPQVFYRRSHSVRLSRRSHVSQRVASTSEQPSQSWALKSRHCGLLVKACGPSGHSGHLLKLAKAPSGHSGHLLKLAKHLLDILDNWREPLAPKGVLGRFCDYRCVVARWPSRSVVPCRPRPRGPRTPWVRLNSNRRCGVRARQRRRLDSASTAAAKAVSCTSPRGLEAPRACTAVSTTRSGPRRPTRARARALSPTSPPRRSTVAVSQLCRGITTEPQRGARPAPPSHELVSRPPRRRKPTRCLKA